MYDRGEVVDVRGGQVRVLFPAQQDMVSGWLDVIVSTTHGEQDWRMPKRGNQVACLLDRDGASGCVLGAIFSAVDPPPSGASETNRILNLLGGARFEYDENSGNLSLVLPGGCDLVGDLRVDGKGRFGGGGEAMAGADKTNARLDALEQHAVSHTHTGVLAGMAASGPAAPPLTPGSSVAMGDLSSD